MDQKIKTKLGMIYLHMASTPSEVRQTQWWKELHDKLQALTDDIDD